MKDINKMSFKEIEQELMLSDEFCYSEYNENMLYEDRVVSMPIDKGFKAYVAAVNKAYEKYKDWELVDDGSEDYDIGLCKAISVEKARKLLKEARDSVEAELSKEEALEAEEKATYERLKAKYGKEDKNG